MVIEPEIEVGTTAETLLPRPAFDGLALMQAGLAKLLHTDVDTHQLHAALELIDTADSMGRQLDAVQNKVFESIDRTGVHTVDGHRTAKTMIAHAGKLSNAEANARRQMMRALRVLPGITAAYEAGLISTCMVKGNPSGSFELLRNSRRSKRENPTPTTGSPNTRWMTPTSSSTLSCPDGKS